MREMAFAWVCELDSCGHRWLAKTETPPALCAKCRRRGWHITKTTAELVREKGADLEDRLRAIVREELAAYSAVADRLTPSPRPEPRVVVDEYSEGYQSPEPRRPAFDPRTIAGVTTARNIAPLQVDPVD